MFTLFIGSKKIKVYGEREGSYTVLPLAYEKDGKVLELRMSTSLPTLDAVRIYVLWWKFLIPLEIPSRLEVAILNFMVFKHLVKDDAYDCYAFGCDVARVPRHDKSQATKYWLLKPLFLKPKVGDVVFFMSPQSKQYSHFYHASVYLGFGLYLSVLGCGGQFEVATLADMKKEFGAKKVYVAIPK